MIVDGVVDTGARPAGPSAAHGDHGGRRADVALAALLLGVSLLTALTGPDVSPAQRIGGVALALLQVPPVLLRRSRPRTALLLYAATVPVQYGLGLPVAALGWPVLAFALLRDPRPALRVLVGVFAGAVVAAAALWALLGARDLAMMLGFAVGIGLVLAPQVAIGAVLGATTRVADRRKARERAAADRARIDAALVAERARIANEIVGGVVQGLRRLTHLAAGLRVRAAADAGSALAELQSEARRVLAGMRRVLVALRDPDRPAEPGTPAAGRRGPFPLPTPSGIALVVGLAAAAVALDALAPDPIGAPAVDRILRLLNIRQELPMTLPLLAVQLLALGWWRSAPLTALVVGTAGAVASTLNASTNFAVEVGWMVLVYGAGVGAPALASAAVTAGCTAAVLVAYLASAGSQARFSLSPSELVGSYALVPLLWAFGALRGRARRQAAVRAQAELADRTRGLVHSERHRIARDLHDVVAHHVSAIAVQAGAARYASDPDMLREAIGHIEESGLRTSDALPALDISPAADDPPLTGAGVERLVEPLRAAGGPVTVEVCGAPPAADGDAERFARRILVEALTNVLRHAGPTGTRVGVVHDDDALHVAVVDAGPTPGHRPARDGSGLGLVGMRERVGLLAGELRAGPEPDGGWAVRARLPRTDLLPEEEITP